MKPPFSFSVRFFRCLLTGWLLVVACTPAVRADDTMRSVQEELRKRNLYFGEVDGLSSPQVAAALRRYQQRKGFPMTGDTDPTTLSSLNLEGPAVAAIPTPSLSPSSPGVANVAVLTTTTTLPSSSAPWPNLPVLRSDAARVGPTPPEPETTAADPDPAPTPHSAPKPPPAAAFQRWPGSEVLHAFVEDFVHKGESNSSGAQSNFFADHVDYFNEGIVTRDFIDKDTEKYNKRWPDRHFTVVDPLTIDESPDHDPSKVVVNFHCRIDVKRPGHDVKGETENSYTLMRTGPETIRITAIKEARVRGR